jgi:Tfp pilus assembly protein PilN
VSAPLNLARRPFRNERLPTLIVGVCCVLLALLTARHLLDARELLPGRALDVEGEAVALEGKVEALRAELGELRRLSAPKEALAEWASVKELVDRRAFSWTSLFAALEQTLPPGVRLTSVSPGAQSGQMTIEIMAAGRSVEDALALLRALQARPDFTQAFLTSVSDKAEGVEMQCSVVYLGAAGGGQ